VPDRKLRWALAISATQSVMRDAMTSPDTKPVADDDAPARVLISGLPDLVAQVAAAMPDTVEVAAVPDIADVDDVCRQAGPHHFDAYVQLPASFEVRGASAIARVHHFYADGVLARFTALDAALPALKPQARLVFVLGVLPDAASTDDDRAARRSLTRVLAHAAQADAGASGLIISQLDSSSPAAEIARVATGDPGGQTMLHGASEANYADWRVEVMGLVMMPT
jgi:hypothetical protein